MLLKPEPIPEGTKGPKNIKTRLIKVDDHGENYECLQFICPGCAEDGSTGLHMLPVNSNNHEPSWKYDGNLAAPTISPSILRRGNGDSICHSYLEQGLFRFLPDSTHSLSGKSGIPLPDLPDWLLK